LVVDTLTILSQYGNSIVAQIQQNLASTGTNATTKTSKSLHFEVKQNGFVSTLRVLGKPYFMVAETGRKPTPNCKPSKEFVASIKERADTKGKGQFAYAIAQNIHKKGTELWQKGGRKAIVSNVVNEPLTEQITKDILAKFAGSLINKIQIVSNRN